MWRSWLVAAGALLLTGLPFSSGGQAMAANTSIRYYLLVLDGNQFMRSGLTIKALVGDVECGALVNAITPPSEAGPRLVLGTTYIVDVAVGAEKPGCGGPPEGIRWLVNGREFQAYAWVGPAGSTAGVGLLLSSGPLPMIVSGHLDGAAGLAEDDAAEVTIGGSVCGEAAITRAAPGGVGGDDRYGAIVLPYGVDQHCGREREPVLITIGGREATQTIPWHGGFVQSDLTLGERPNPSTASRHWLWFGAGLAVGAAGASVLACGYALARRRAA